MERFENRPKPKRNYEKDKRSFVEAIVGARILEIPTEFDERAVDSLKTELAHTKVFLPGETHGIRENPDIIYTLFKKFDFRNLALEWDPSLTEKVKHFLDTGDIDFETIQDSPDGRITAGHFALLKKLKEEGALDTLVCFDQGGGVDWDARDANMARNILANLSESPMLVVAGSAHTNIKPIDFEDGEGEHHPMGENIRKQIPEAPSGRIESQSGVFHNIGAKEFEKEFDEEVLVSPQFYKSDEGIYIFKLPEAHAAIVPNPDEILD